VVLTIVANMLLACATGPASSPPGLGALAGEWRGRWLGPVGHGVAALTIEPSGAYRATMFLDGGDREARGAIVMLPSGRLRYLGGEGDGEVRIETAGTATTLRFVPDGGGGGGTFRRVP
jgi:hypothetical protein